jgi:hypothetical protein
MRTEEKIVQVKNEVLKIVNVDRIVERNIETIKEVTSGRERIVPVHIDKIIEVPIMVNVPQVLNIHILNNVLSFDLICTGLSARKCKSGTAAL